MATPRLLSASLMIVCVGLVVVLTVGPVRSQGLSITRVAAAPAGGSDYENASIDSVVDLLEQLTGKHFIRDANLGGTPPITVKTTGLTNEESVKLITATLLLNGVAIVPVDDHTMKVITCGTNKNPRSEGVRAYTNEADLPASDEIVTYYMQMDHINPLEAAGIFTQVAPVHMYGSYVPTSSSNGLVLTENVSVIRELIALKKVIDVNNPGPPRPSPPGPPPPRPPGPVPGHPGGGMVIFTILILLAVAAGNFFARVWLGRKPARPPA